MTDLVERYVHQVGHYLPPKERAEIEAELRSQIQDQLDDRFPGVPSPEQVAAVLAELGHPYRIAASYSGDRYLVGPMLYPYLMMVLRRVWLIVPAIMVFLSIFGALTASPPASPFTVLLETVWSVVQATLMVTAVVVLFFAVLQQTFMQRTDDEANFNPLELPEVDNLASIDRFETIFGIVAGSVGILVFLYFLRVGGLTLRFNLNDPGAVIASPAGWMLALVLLVAGQVIMHLLALRENRWSAGTLLGQTVVEIASTIPFYFAVTSPLVQRLITDHPNLASVVFITRAPELFAVAYAVITLIGRGTALVRLWSYRGGDTSPFTVKAD